MTNLIPNKKIYGQRMGQLIFNAIAEISPKNLNKEELDIYVADKLFFIENESLEKLITFYLRKMKSFEIQDKYDFLKPTKDNLMDKGFECWQGWFPLLESLFQKIDIVVQKKGIKNFQIKQIKQKLGDLRIYYQPQDLEISALVRAAEEQASRTCELCGNIGRLRKNGRVGVLCNKCKKK